MITDGSAISECSELTSLRVCRAGQGETESVAWVVGHFTPLLQVQAEYRLRGPVRRFCDPDDLVGEVWLAVLPRLRDLRARDGQWTQVLLKFLSTTLLHKLNHALTSYARASYKLEAPLGGEWINAVGQGNQSASASTLAARDEVFRRLHEVLERLEPEEREILVLRGIEQLPHADVARIVGGTVGSVTMRCHRTLAKLRSRLAGAFLEGLADD